MKLPKNYKVKQNELNSKVILVTGANKGFGLAISMDLAKAGATVIMLGRDLSSLEYESTKIRRNFRKQTISKFEVTKNNDKATHSVKPHDASNVACGSIDDINDINGRNKRSNFLKLHEKYKTAWRKNHPI